MSTRMICSALCLAVLALGQFEGWAAETIARPDDKLADMTKPVQVLILLGQSTKGCGGNGGLVLDAHLAVDGKSGKYPEFKGNMATIYTKPMAQGGSGNGHYGGRAEVYMDVGEAMGRAMLELLKKSIGYQVMNKTRLLGVSCLLASAAAGFVNASAAEYTAAHPLEGSPVARKPLKELQGDFLKLKFGMFIHFRRLGGLKRHSSECPRTRSYLGTVLRRAYTGWEGTMRIGVCPEIRRIPMTRTETLLERNDPQLRPPGLPQNGLQRERNGDQHYLNHEPATPSKP